MSNRVKASVIVEHIIAVSQRDPPRAPRSSLGGLSLAQAKIALKMWVGEKYCDALRHKFLRESLPEMMQGAQVLAALLPNNFVRNEHWKAVEGITDSKERENELYRLRVESLQNKDREEREFDEGECFMSFCYFLKTLRPDLPNPYSIVLAHLSNDKGNYGMPPFTDASILPKVRPKNWRLEKCGHFLIKFFGCTLLAAIVGGTLLPVLLDWLIPEKYFGAVLLTFCVTMGFALTLFWDLDAEGK